MKKSDDYAGNQVRIFLGNLKNGTHPVKLKAIQQFQNYVQSYVPNISDDNVDFLFTGNLDGKATLGLIHFCGVESEKHDGQLKRICAPAITLLHWLVTFIDDTIYYERFIRLTKDELIKVNFPKHILQPTTENKLTLTRSRINTDDSVFELLSILLHDHRNIDDDLEAVDIPYLLGGSKVCQDRLEDWLQKANLEHINQTLELLKAGGQGQSNTSREPVFATTWEAINFKCVPLQEGEEIGTAEIDEGPKDPPPIPDPLGIRDIDLREAQKIFSTGGLKQSSSTGRRGSITVNDGSSFRHKLQESHEDDDDDNDDDEDDSPHDHVFIAASRGRRTTNSIIPSDKNFSTSTFLSLVHGKSDFSELKKGLEHLNDQLQQQSRRRENLVRTHFGLFVQCADGLEWLKAYRQGNTERKSNITKSSNELSGNNGDKGMEKLKKAHITLDVAKVEAKKTLAPILERMKHGREIRSAEKVLRGMSTALEYPFLMKKALDRNDLKDVVTLYQRVQSVPGNSSLKIIPKIKKAADGVVSELRKICLTQLFNPSFNYVEINKHAQILLELDGPSYYAQVVRMCFIRQLLHFLSLCNDAKLKFMADSVEAFENGQELNILSKNSASVVGSSDNETVANAVKKFVASSRKRSVSLSHDLIKASKRVSASRTSVMRGSFSHVHIDDIGVDDGENGHDEFDDDVMDENVIEDSGGIELWIQSIMSQSSRESPSARRASISPFASSDLDDAKFRDYSEILCHMVRKAYCEQIVEIVSRSFPCLFRLSCDTLVANLTTQLPGNTPFPLERSGVLGSTGGRGFPSQLSTRGPGILQSMQSMRAPMLGGNSVPLNKPIRTGLSASKLLALGITISTESIAQSINGYYSSSNSINLDGTRNVFVVPTELLSSFNDLDQFLAQLPAQFGGWALKVDFGEFLSKSSVQGQAKAATISANITRFYELIQSAGTNSTGIASSATVSSASAALRQSMLQPFHQDCLSDVYLLYDGLESVMKVAYDSFTGKESSGDSRKLAFASYVVSGRGEKDFIELDFNSSASPYHEPMLTLCNLAKEGEAQIAVKVLEKVLDRSYYISDCYLADSDGGNLSARDFATRNSITLGTVGSIKGMLDGGSSNRETGVELAVMEFESLILRSINALKARLKRPSWSSGVFYEHLLQKILSSFIERLRRRAMYIEDSKMSTLLPKSEGYIAQSPSDTKRNRKKSMTARVSMHQNHLILQSLEEDLRYCESGWERDNTHFDPLTKAKQRFSTSDPKSKSKHIEWIDCIRGYIRLRTCSIPRIMSISGKLFSMDFSQSIFMQPPHANHSSSGGLFPEVSASVAGVSNSNTGGSLLNRLFAFDSSSDPAAASAAATNPANNNTPIASNSPTKSIPTAVASTPDAQNINLFDKIMSTITQSLSAEKGNNYSNLATQWYFTHTSAGSLLLPMLKDIISREVENADRYVAFRIKSLQSILNAGYANLVHREFENNFVDPLVDPVTEMPVHLSRIILAIHDEKLLLCSTIRNLSIETGGGKDEYGLSYIDNGSSVSKGHGNSDGEDDERDRVGGDDNDDDVLGIISSNEYQPESRASDSAFTELTAHTSTFMSVQGPQGQRYKHYLYQELCKGCIVLYEDLMKRLASGQYAIPNNANVLIPTKTLQQAWIEWEYLKIILRPLLPMLDFQVQSQRTTSISLSTQELQSIVATINQDKTKCPGMVTRESLLRVGKLLSAMIL